MCCSAVLLFWQKCEPILPGGEWSCDPGQAVPAYPWVSMSSRAERQHAGCIQALHQAARATAWLLCLEALGPCANFPTVACFHLHTVEQITSETRRDWDSLINVRSITSLGDIKQTLLFRGPSLRSCYESIKTAHSISSIFKKVSFH